jgi:hypothetical protein
MGGRKVTGALCLKSFSLSLSLSPSLCQSVCHSLLPGHHEVSSFASTHAAHHDVLPCHSPKVMGPSNHGLTALQLGVTISLSVP